MRRRVLFWPVLVAGLYLIVILGRDLWQVLTADRRVDSAQSKVAELAKEREELQQELVWVETDEFVEREAREKLMLSRPGEKTVLLPKQEGLGEVEKSRQVEESRKETLPPWRQWWSLFVY